MGKKRLGQSVVNWHRSLGSNELSQHYRRVRNSEPKHSLPWYELSEEDTNELIETQYHSRFAEWNRYEHYYHYDPALNSYYSCFDLGDESDISQYKLDLLLEQVIQPSGIQFPVGLLDELELCDPQPDENEAESPGFPSDSRNLEERLISHLSIARSASDNHELLRSAIMDSIGDLSNQAVVERELEPRCVKLVYLFAPFWVRRPLDWDPSGGNSLVDHLLVMYQVPRFLYNVWRCELDTNQLKWICWFMIFAQGGSLKKAARKFQWSIPARLPHFLHEIRSDFLAEEATVYAAIRSMGGTERDFLRFAQQPAYVVDITSPMHNRSYVKFWRETVRWFIKHGASITDDDSGQILDWAMHKYTESQRDGGTPFSWKKRGVRSALERSRAYHEQISTYQSNGTWPGHGWDWSWIDEYDNHWSFTELTSGEELFNEGRAMNHCVSSYASRCANGYTAIVSLCENRMRRITIEIRPSSLRIAQARGRANRGATLEEKHVISLWHEVIMQNPREDTAFLYT